MWKFNVDDYIKAIRVCKYFTTVGVIDLMIRYPNEEHIKIALQIKTKGAKQANCEKGKK